MTLNHLSLQILQTAKLFQELSKSGILLLVLISVLAGYGLGHPLAEPFQWTELFETLCGIFFLAAGSSALNQYQEWEQDEQMPRTARRPIPSKRISPKAVLFFSLSCIGIGLAVLYKALPDLFYLGCVATFSYNGLYTLWWKKHWAYAAIPGALPGALPILMGHVAAQKNLFHPLGLYLFFILFFWQMPHFWTLALHYSKDYQAGGFPTLPVRYGPRLTLHHILVWCLAYVALLLIAPLFMPLGWFYFLPALCLSAKLILELCLFYQKPESRKWIHFFLWINLSLILYLAFALLDQWLAHFSRFF